MANESVRIWTAVLTAMAAVLLTAGSVLGAAGANAVGACTGIMNQGLVQYSQCATNSGAHCTSSLGNFTGGHVTCTYPDGGRDECDYTGTVGFGPSSGTCTYIPSGSEAARTWYDQ